MTAYSDFHRRSITQRDAFWAEQAALIDWKDQPKQICDYSNPPFARWYVGGTTNLCYNAVDRHLKARADQAALMSGLVRFEAKIARDIMIPENRVTAVNLAWDVRQVREVAIRSGHSRFPVYDGSLIKNVKGVLHIKQMVGLADSDSVARLVRPPVFISQSMRLHDLLQRFKDQRVHLAIVVDDAGDTVGVVTLEDVLEQIVGQIFDETDRAPFPGVAAEQGGAHLVDGQESLRRIEELIGVDLPELEGVGSVGDLLTHLGGQIPTTGSVFLWEGLRFRVLEADARHLVRVRVDRPTDDSALADG